MGGQVNPDFCTGHGRVDGPTVEVLVRPRACVKVPRPPHRSSPGPNRGRRLGEEKGLITGDPPVVASGVRPNEGRLCYDVSLARDDWQG